MIHVGMAGGRDFYSVERRGHRDGYFTVDVDGVILGDERCKGGDGEGKGCEDGEVAPGDGDAKRRERDNGFGERNENSESDGYEGVDRVREGDLREMDAEERKDIQGRQKDGNCKEKWVWEGCPEVLETSVDIDDVCRRWRVALPVCLSRNLPHSPFLSFLPPISLLQPLSSHKLPPQTPS
jgi:hypothetical protein